MVALQVRIRSFLICLEIKIYQMESFPLPSFYHIYFPQLSACLKISICFHFSRRQQEQMTGRQKIEETMSKMLHNTNEKLLWDDLIVKTKNHLTSSPQNIILASDKTPVTSQEASISQKEIGLPALKPRDSLKMNLFTKLTSEESQPKPTYLTSALEMLFGEKNRGVFDYAVPEVNNNKMQRRKC